MQSQVDKQADIIARQQRFLEGTDRKERECSLIITGVPDVHECVEGATSCTEKIAKIREKVCVNTEVREVCHRDRDSRVKQVITVALWRWFKAAPTTIARYCDE